MFGDKTIRRISAISIATLMAGMLILVGLWLLYQGASHEVRRAYENRYYSYLLADELRQSSDDLTRLARTYVVTGSDAFENQYWDIVAIRNGEKPRPREYHRVYWDFIAAGKQPPTQTGQAASLRDLMVEAGFTEAEFAKLREAQANSDDLISLETEAMNAIKGLYPDDRGKYVVRDDPNFDRARKLVHSEDYHLYKANIMAPINEFFDLLDKRTQGAVDDAQAQADRYSAAIVVFMVAIVTTALLAASAFPARLAPPGPVKSGDAAPV